MKLTLIFVLVFSLSGCATISQSSLISQLKGAGCEIRSLTFQKESTKVMCMGFNTYMYNTERAE